MTEPVSILHESRGGIGQRFNLVVKIRLKQFEELCQTAAFRYRMSIEMKLRVRLCQPQEQVIQIAEQPTGLRPDTIGIVRHGNRHTIHHLLLRLTKSNTELHLDAQAVSRGRCLAEFFKLFQPDLHYEVESLTDPAPALMEYRNWFSHLTGSRS